MTNNAPAATATPAHEIVFFALVPEQGYWIGRANHACADPEYVHIPEHFVTMANSAGFCPGADAFRIGESLCRCCQILDDGVPF